MEVYAIDLTQSRESAATGSICTDKALFAGMLLAIRVAAT
jgi:hypothetical protein